MFRRFAIAAGPKPFAQLAYSTRVNRGLAPLVDAGGFRPGDPPHLTLASAIRFELGKYSEPVKEAFPSCRARVDGLLRGLQRGALFPKRANDVLKVRN